MAKQGLYSTVEIALVLRLFSDFRKGKPLKVTEEEHQFLQRCFEPGQMNSYMGDECQYVTYRNWVLVYTSSHFNTRAREAIEATPNPDYTLNQMIDKAMLHQSADILRVLRYEGKPLGLLVQCAMVEISFKLGYLPRRQSEGYVQASLQTLAEELQTNSTFNI